jgi:hypothetical protein
MIDINYYRQYEDKAKDSLPTWVTAQKYNVDIFEKVGFPVRLANIQQTKQIFDTMQENRFEKFMDEIGGFTDDELYIFVRACIKNLEFQSNYFPKEKSFLPLDTLINSFITYKKIRAINPDIKKIFEIGPGSGGFSFYLENFTGLNEYSYTDACESFYMLQNNINFFLFKDKFNQNVLQSSIDKSFINKENTSYLQGGFESREYILNKSKSTFNCNAYPWWKLGEFNDNSSKFDVITSNANLTEFNEGALNDYLSIMNNKLTDNGVVFAHCTGGGYEHGKTLKYLFDKFYQYKLAVVFFLRGDNSYTCPQSNQKINKVFALDNLMLIGEKHPWFQKYYKKPDFSVTSKIPIQEEDLYNSFFPSSQEMKKKKKYTKKNLRDIIVKQLEAEENI